MKTDKATRGTVAVAGAGGAALLYSVRDYLGEDMTLPMVVIMAIFSLTIIVIKEPEK